MKLISHLLDCLICCSLFEKLWLLLIKEFNAFLALVDWCFHSLIHHASFIHHALIPAIKSRNGSTQLNVFDSRPTKQHRAFESQRRVGLEQFSNRCMVCLRICNDFTVDD